MGGRFRLPMYVIAAGLLGLIALLATLQYKWLGQISNAERERMKSTLSARATAFAQDFDRELTRAYLLFQIESASAGDNLSGRMSARYDRWHATARYPKLIKDFLLVTKGDALEPPRLQRFNPATRFVEPAEWPESLREVQAQIADKPDPSPEDAAFVVRTIAGPLWEDVPALVVPAPVLLMNGHAARELHLAPFMSYTVLVLDLDYMTNEMLPALAQQHFRDTAEDFDYQLAVVSAAGRGLVYHSATDFTPRPETKTDASVDLFQVRTQEFVQMAAEVRRFAAMSATASFSEARLAGGRGTTQRFTTILKSPLGGAGESVSAERFTLPLPDGDRRLALGEPLSIVVQRTGPGRLDRSTFGAAPGAAAARPNVAAARWRLMVKHPSGSLEGAVNAARQRNLLVSSSILAVLGVSLGLLVLSTRRAQELARQQMEFVAAVSHELRTPLAVIRSAGENLADGVVRDDGQIRKYGELVRSEGRRLSEMVEQILEFSGIQSGQRGFSLRPVPVAPLLEDVVSASGALVEDARLTVEFDIPSDLPPMLGDEQALRRVFQNLVTNAIKYGAGGGWIGLRARKVGQQVRVSVTDRGPGIAAAEQPKIFDPFYRAAEAVSAQIQGAGLGLSLVRRIVEAHGGKVSVKSAPGAGAEFAVYLPAAEEQPVVAEAPDRGTELPRYS